MSPTSHVRPISIDGTGTPGVNFRIDDMGDRIVLGMRTSRSDEKSGTVAVSMELVTDDLGVLLRLRDRLEEMIDAQHLRLVDQPKYTARYVGDMARREGTKLPDDGTKDTVLIAPDHPGDTIAVTREVEGRDRSRLTDILRRSGFRVVGEVVENGYDVFRLVRLPKQP